MSYEIRDPEWPAVTQDFLQDHTRLKATHDPSQINQALFALIEARKALMDARLACLRAAQFHAERPKVKDRLTSIASTLAQEHARFPLTVTNKRKTWRDQAAWAKPLLAPEVMTTKARRRATKLERPLSDSEANRLLHRVVQEMLGKENIDVLRRQR